MCLGEHVFTFLYSSPLLLFNIKEQFIKGVELIIIKLEFFFDSTWPFLKKNIWSRVEKINLVTYQHTIEVILQAIQLVDSMFSNTKTNT